MCCFNRIGFGLRYIHDPSQQLIAEKYEMDARREELLATRAESQSSDSFRVQINNYDSYQAPVSVFDRPTPPRTAKHNYHHVPVLRVFGSLPTGHNILVHVHGVFPYLYIRYEKEDCLKLQYRLENALASSLSKTENETGDIETFKYIAHVSICKGVPFYGYHVGHDVFFKIHLLNPSYTNRMADLLRDGVLGRQCEVFEAHIPYGLQFLADYNLFGCGWLRLRDLFIREPILTDESLKTDELVEYMMGYHTTETSRIGRSALEIDVCAQHIMNRDDLKERNLHHDFVEKFHPIDPDFIYIQSTKDLWKDGEFQRNMRGKEPYSSPPAQVRKTAANEWVESKENEILFDYVKGLNPGEDPNFTAFVKKNPALDTLPTAFESIPELFYEPEFDVEVSTQEDSTGEETDLEQPEIYEPDEFDHQRIAQEDFEVDLEEEEEVADAEVQPPTASDEAHETTIGSISDIQLTHELHTRFKRRRVSGISKSQRPSKLKLPSRLAGGNRFIYKRQPPRDIDFDEVGLPEIQYDDPYYEDIPPKPFINAGRKFKLESRLLSEIKQVTVDGESIDTKPHGTISVSDTERIIKWKYLRRAPTYKEVANDHRKVLSSQIGVTQGFKFGTQADVERRSDGFNDMAVLICEVLVPTRGDLRPDPKHDPVVAIIWRTMCGDQLQEGLLTTNTAQQIPNMDFTFFEDELDMIEVFAELVTKMDPDIIAGYEVHNSSWGYIFSRARVEYGYEFIKDISRCSSKGHNRVGDHWGYTHTSNIKVCGRHVINIWRPLKELNLARNTIEYVAYHLLHQRIPHYTYKSLTEMMRSDYLGVVKYLRQRAAVDANLLKSAEIISKATEEARMIGIDFNDVFYRGSQYKVESCMIRIAKAENFILLSPSKKQVRKQKPLECIPLVMEPISAYYKSPLLVLDFQSLYPSIIIAYNYCYSTLLGRLKNYSDTGFNVIGTGKVKHPPGLLKLLENDVTLSPNGLMFVKSSVRKSLMAKMLGDILDTRVMVKSTMKYLDSSLKQLYNNRQLALKLTANVTYGYASASFSGRMPCSDIADAIVQTARETLERSIQMIENEASWGAKVVYGDTDSLFVYLPGRSREDAFKLGQEMATAVTRANPDPVTLKFEKVYHPSLLMAKKRYVGYSYEHMDSLAKFDAKGIETVRRDGVPAQQHIMEQSLRKLFETNNISSIKSFVVDEFSKILNNDLSIQDFCFARAVRVGTYRNLPPGAIVSEKKMKEDARAEPQYKERVPYVIIEEQGSILRERARSPEEFIRLGLTLDAEYYIVKTLIPPLERIFNLVGVDVRAWYAEIPKRTKKSALYGKKCLSCENPSKEALCPSCREDELQTVLTNIESLKVSQTRMKELLMVCRSCSGDASVWCESQDCPVYYKRVRTVNRLTEMETRTADVVRELEW